MTVTTTGTLTFTSLPESFHQVSACPHCGAPIYVDAKIQGEEQKEYAKSLQTPFFTCNCRLTLQPQPMPYPVFTPAPTPTYPYSPGFIPIPNTPIFPQYPQPGWTVTCNVPA